MRQPLLRTSGPLGAFAQYEQNCKAPVSDPADPEAQSPSRKLPVRRVEVGCDDMLRFGLAGARRLEGRKLRKALLPRWRKDQFQFRFGRGQCAAFEDHATDVDGGAWRTAPTDCA